MRTSPTFLVRLIQHEAFWIMALCTLLIPQVASSVRVFADQNTQYDQPWFAWCYAVGIDLAVLIFSVRGKLLFAWLYLVVMVFHALIGQLLPAQSLPGIILVHITLPVTIFTFTHLFYYRKKEVSNESDDLASPNANAERLTTLMAQGIRFEAQPYVCPQCGTTAATGKQLNGHISGHKMTHEWFPEKYGNWQEQNRQRAHLLQQADMNITH